MGLIIERHHGSNSGKSRGSNRMMRSPVLENIRQRVLLSWSTLWYNGGMAGRLSLALNLVSVLVVLAFWFSTTTTTHQQQQEIVGYKATWHGGHPKDDQSGACWCGSADQYCMCTPSIAIDLIVAGRTKEDQQEYVWLVRRKDTSQLATMGGFVQVGENVEQAVHRELKEEMNIEFSPQDSSKMMLLGVYSDPRRDNRRHTVGIVYVVHFGDHEDDDFLQPRAADDVKEVKRVYLKDVQEHEYFADHYTILQDYKDFVQQHNPPEKFFSSSVPAIQSPGDFANDIIRSLC